MFRFCSAALHSNADGSSPFLHLRCHLHLRSRRENLFTAQTRLKCRLRSHTKSRDWLQAFATQINVLLTCRFADGPLHRGRLFCARSHPISAAGIRTRVSFFRTPRRRIYISWSVINNFFFGNKHAIRLTLLRLISERRLLLKVRARSGLRIYQKGNMFPLMHIPASLAAVNQFSVNIVPGFKGFFVLLHSRHISRLDPEEAVNFTAENEGVWERKSGNTRSIKLPERSNSPSVTLNQKRL